MKPPSGPKPGAQPRTLRGRALERGTAPGGFPDDAEPYNPQAGTPDSLSGGKYASNVDAPGTTPSSTPIPDPSPFKLGPQ